MELDHAELLREELISLRERLLVMEACLPISNAGELAERVSVCLDYLFHLGDIPLLEKITEETEVIQRGK